MLVSDLDSSKAVNWDTWAVTLIVKHNDNHSQIIIERPEEKDGLIEVTSYLAEFAGRAAWLGLGFIKKLNNMRTGPGKPSYYKLPYKVKYLSKGETYLVAREKVERMVRRIKKEIANFDAYPTYYDFLGDEALFSFKQLHFKITHKLLRDFKEKNRSLFEELYKYFENISPRMRDTFFSDKELYHPDCHTYIIQKIKLLDNGIVEIFCPGCLASIKKEVLREVIFGGSLSNVKERMKTGTEIKFAKLIARVFLPDLYQLFNFHVKLVDVQPDNCMTWAQKKMWKYLDITPSPSPWYDFIITLPK